MPAQSVKVCARCSGENSRSASVCSHCGARLPNMDLASPSLNHQVDQLAGRYNELVEACDRIRHEEIGFDDFADFLKAFSEALREKRRKAFILNDDGEAEFDDDGDEEGDYQDLPEFEHFRKGIAAMWPYLDDADPVHLDRGLDVVREGNEKLLNPSLREGGESIAPEAHANSAACVLCGTENDIGAAVCENCGAKLPKFDTTSVPQEKHAQVTERYDQFKRAVERLRGGQWSVQEFGAFLEEVEENLRGRRQKYQGVLGESDYAEFASEEVGLAASGMDDYEAGIDELWRYIEDQSPGHLDRALTQIGSGNEKINRAMVMNRSFRKELTEQFGYI